MYSLFKKEIKTNKLMMTESKLTATENKLKKLVGEYREKAVQLEKELQSVRNEEMAAFRQVVFGVIQKYAADNKYDLIVNEGVMFASDNVNITNDIMSLVTKAAN